MVSRNADKQRRYRQRLKARGLVHVQGWVTPEQAEAIRRIMAERGGEVPTAARGGRVRRRAPSRAEGSDRDRDSPTAGPDGSAAGAPDPWHVQGIDPDPGGRAFL